MGTPSNDGRKHNTAVTTRSNLARQESIRRPVGVRRLGAALQAEMPPRHVLLASALALVGAIGTLLLIGWRRTSATVHPPIQIGLVLVAGASVAIADTLIKRAVTSSGSFSATLSHPLFLLAVALYVLQIVLIAYVFVMRWDLSTLGLSQVIVYAATVVFVGTILFQERITVAHGIGLALALAAALLMSA